MPEPIVKIEKVAKTYSNQHTALKEVNLEFFPKEIFALLGPNGAGKTTLISIICGLVNATSGRITIDGYDHVKEYKKARSRIGLVPQELTTDAFESVWNAVTFTRGLFGLAPNPTLIEKILKDLSLWDKKDQKIMTLSGGMKRRLLIAKALSHEPKILFLDEPSAGVDVELRKSMWELVHHLRESGVTILLTTHYIEEAEEMADRIGVINKGEIVLVDEKASLLKKLGQKTLTIEVQTALKEIPTNLKDSRLILSENGKSLQYHFDASSNDKSISHLLEGLHQEQIQIVDLNTKQSSLEDIFVQLVRK